MDKGAKVISSMLSVHLFLVFGQLRRWEMDGNVMDMDFDGMHAFNLI